jgi:HPt (histidine-containing phosphotransfer) domain-containing protein
MDTGNALTGLNLAALAEGFTGSEDVLAQMLGLFETQARQRLDDLKGALAAKNAEDARKALHSLVNISGAVRAYALAELARMVGEALRREDLPSAQSCALALEAEARLVLRQASVLLAGCRNPATLWQLTLPS